MEKINSSGTEDGERYIMELMITSHSHKFTQIMQMKSYYELCSVYTLSIHCSDHFQWVIRCKFSMTISLLARRHRDAEGLILYRCVFLFLLVSAPNIWGHWTDLNQTWHTFTYDCYLKNLVLSPRVFRAYHPRAWGKTTFWDELWTLTENISAKEHNIKSTIGKKLVNL